MRRRGRFVRRTAVIRRTRPARRGSRRAACRDAAALTYAQLARRIRCERAVQDPAGFCAHFLCSLRVEHRQVNCESC